MFFLIFYVHVRIHTRFWKRKNALISTLLCLNVAHGHSESQSRSEGALAVFTSFLLPLCCVLAALPVSKSDDDDVDVMMINCTAAENGRRGFAPHLS